MNSESTASNEAFCARGENAAPVSRGARIASASCGADGQSVAVGVEVQSVAEDAPPSSRDGLAEAQIEFDRLWLVYNMIYHAYAQNAGLSDSACSILYELSLRDGLSQKALCELTSLTKQTVNSSVRKLRDEGIVALEAGAGRELRVMLTEAGRALVRERIEPLRDAETAALASLGTQGRDAMLRLMRDYVSALRGRLLGGEPGEVDPIVSRVSGLLTRQDSDWAAWMERSNRATGWAAWGSPFASDR